MGRFYNKTRTPLSASSTKGRAITFPSREWAYVPINEESSQAIQNYVRKGMLARADAPEDAVLMAAAAVPALPAPTPAPKPVTVAPVALAPTPAPVEDTVVVEDSITSNVTEVSDPPEESVALDDPSVADSLPRSRHREHRRR